MCWQRWGVLFCTAECMEVTMRRDHKLWGAAYLMDQCMVLGLTAFGRYPWYNTICGTAFGRYPWYSTMNGTMHGAGGCSFSGALLSRPARFTATCVVLGLKLWGWYVLHRTMYGAGVGTDDGPKQACLVQQKRVNCMALLAAPGRHYA
jgi:hypothetical protein